MSSNTIKKISKFKYYYFQCGHSSFKTNSVKRKGFKKYEQLCPKCMNGFVMAVKVFCKTCENEIGILPTKKGMFTCEACKHAVREKEKKIAKEKAKKQREEAKKERLRLKLSLKNKDKNEEVAISFKKEPIRNFDCKYYETYCFKKAYLKNISLNCDGCIRYEKIDIFEEERRPMLYAKDYAI